MGRSAHESLESKWTDVVLTIISIVQGLAFNDLAERTLGVWTWVDADLRLVVGAYLLCCGAVLIRIFQTYLVAALDYGHGLPTLFDILFVFVLGGVEYWLFSTVGDDVGPASFRPVHFQRIMSVLAVLGTVGYGLTVARLMRTRQRGMTALRRRTELRLQRMNFLGLLVIAVVALCLGWIAAPAHASKAWSPILFGTILFANTAYSMSQTFGRLLVTERRESGTARRGAAVTEKEEALVVEYARLEDADAVSALLLESFGYVFGALFEASPRLAQRILADVLVGLGGRHQFGLSSIVVARRASTGERTIVGFSMFHPHARTRSGDAFRTTLAFLGAVYRHQGMHGVRHAIGMWRRIRGIGDRARADAGYLTYLAVTTSERSTGVGRHLLAKVEEECRDVRVRDIWLDVREDNVRALVFFERHGYARRERVVDPVADPLLEQGPRLRMRKQLDR